MTSNVKLDTGPCSSFFYYVIDCMHAIQLRKVVKLAVHQGYV